MLVAAAVAELERALDDAQQRLDDVEVRAAQAVEEYDAAVVRLVAAQTAERAALADVTRTSAAAMQARTELGRWAAAAYRSGGPMSGWSAVLSARGAADLVRRGSALRFIGEARAGALARAVAAEALAERARDTAAQAVDGVTTTAAAADAARSAALGEVAAQQAQVQQLSQTRTTLLARLAEARRTTSDEEAARLAQGQAAASRAAADWALRNTLPRPGSVVPLGTSAGAARAVAFALEQVGKPYLWGGAGPDSFDCSGLTMRAWERGAVGLPHYSAGQAQLVPPVPLAEMRPGDLVFFASDPRDVSSVYHVGLYVGGGQMVEAPRPGAAVRVAPVWQPHLFGAGRP